jgi:signal transduction histidine kinase/ligand-binding sensor domain-containing protein
MRAKFFSILGILIWVQSLSVWAQISDFPIIQYNIKLGLSHEYITAIQKDQVGFIWVSTHNGLNRFDGVRFESFDLFTQGASHNAIFHFAPDNEGWFWLVTFDGVLKFNPLTQELQKIALPENWTNIAFEKQKFKISFDKQGFAWLATQDYLYKIHPKTHQYRRFAMPFKASRTFFRTMVDSRGRIWVQISTALYLFDEKTQKFTYFYGIDDQHTENSAMVDTVPYEDSARQLWLATWFDYPRLFNENTKKFEPVGNKTTVITNFQEDIDDNGKRFLWASGGETGVQILDLDALQLRPISVDACLPYSHNQASIICFFKDSHSGIVWIGTDRGLEKYDPWAVRFNRLHFANDPPIKFGGDVNTFWQDNQNPDIVWISAWIDGIYRWNRKTNQVEHFNHKNTPMTDIGIFDLVQDKQGNIWLASGGGISRFNYQKKEWKFFRDFFSRKGVVNNALCMLKAQNEWLWFGCNYEGLWYIDPKQLQPTRWRFADIDWTERHYITKIIEDSKGTIWVASHAGVYRVKPTENLTEKIPLGKYGKQRVAINSIFQSRNQHFWVLGSSFILELDKNTQLLKEINLQSGLRGHPYSIIEDELGYLWIGTDNGLYLLNPKTYKMRHFTQEDGIVKNVIDSKINRLPSGEVFLGFGGAANYFKPQYFKYNSRPPILTFKAIKINNEPRKIDFKQTLTLQPHEIILNFSFVALNYTLSEKNKYAYKMEGFEEKWVYTEDMQANYTNLAPGNYTFRVIGANNDGIWNREGIAIKLVVLAPFYQQWWFRLAISALIVGVVWGIWNYRQKQREKLDAIRNRIAKDLHDDMGSTLSSIRIYSEVLQRQLADNQPNSLPLLQRISQGAATLSESMQDIIWSIKTEYDSLEDMLARMRAFALKLLEAKNIQFKTIISENFKNIQLNIAQRRNIYLIFKEAINNSVKYAECSEVELNLQIFDNQLVMIIQDNGKGFDLEAVSRGNGLQNFQKRAQELKGTCVIDSEIGKGTRVELRLKV